MVDTASYASARDLFEAAGDARREIAWAEGALERMRSREQVRGSRMGATGRGGACDPTRPTDERMDWESLMGRRIEADRELVDYAHAVLFGRDGLGGVAALVGWEPAMAVKLSCVDGLKLEDVARRLGISPRSVSRSKDMAMDAVDFHGCGACIGGIGQAV